MLKELIFTGIGASVLFKEKVEDELKKLKDEGKIDSEDIKDFINSLEEKGKNEETKLKDEIRRHVKEIIDDLDLVTKEDLENLKKELK